MHRPIIRKLNEGPIMNNPPSPLRLLPTTPRLRRPGLRDRLFKLVCLSIVLSAPAHAMQNDTDLGMQLIDAAEAGDHKEIERLIETDAPVNYVDGYSRLALHFTAARGHLNCLQLLIAAKAQVNLATTDGWTALMCAAKERNLSCIKALIAARAQVNHADKNSWTALMYASSHKSQSICELLVERMLWILNKEQKAKIATFLGIAKFRKSLCLPGLDANLRNELKAPCPTAAYEDNKKNFMSSIAYQEINKIWNSAIKKALLEKYNAAATTSNSQSGV